IDWLSSASGFGADVAEGPTGKISHISVVDCVCADMHCNRCKPKFAPQRRNDLAVREARLRSGAESALCCVVWLVRGCRFAALSKEMTKTLFMRKQASSVAHAMALFLLTSKIAWSKPVPGSLDVHCNQGPSASKPAPPPTLKVRQYEPQKFILEQSPCSDFEANFIYLLIGADKALLIDTGAVADAKAMPLAKTILELLPDKEGKKLALLVAHTHRHLDHRAG